MNGISSLRVLLVCTGNVCRSPALQMILRSGMSGPSWSDLGIQVASAGTAAMVGRPIEPMMGECLGELGIAKDSDFRARQVTPDLVETSAVIMTATRAHRAEVFRLVPGALRRTFTVSELVERARSWVPYGSTAVERLSALAEHAAQQRGNPMFRRPGDEDVVDPYGRSRRVHRRVAAHLVAAAGELTEALIDRPTSSQALG